MNLIIRTKLIASINAAAHDAIVAEQISHRFLRGRIREIALANLIRPVLPGHLSVGTGKVTDIHGQQSGEVDLVIYSSNLVPPLMYSEELGVFPCESTLAVVEVKSRATASELRGSLQSMATIKNFVPESGRFDQQGRPIPHEVKGIFRWFFAFSSDLDPEGKGEFQRYKELDPKWNEDPGLEGFCVLGRGYWICDRSARPVSWNWVPATDEREEVIMFLRILSDTSVMSFAERLNPILGGYLNEHAVLRPNP